MSKKAKKEAPASESAPIVRWLGDVVEHDFLAAQAYLSLRLDEEQATTLVSRLRSAKVTTRRANDILRACGRDALSLEDPGVRRDLIKAVSGERLSPVLVVSGRVGPDIADGYHRVSLAYHLDPFGDVPLRIASSK
jgi:hypothetical protein